MTEQEKTARKIEMLKAMNLLVLSIDNWNASTGWQFSCLDLPTDKDYSEAASDDSEFKNCCDCFIATMNEFGVYGFCVRDSEKENRKFAPEYAPEAKLRFPVGADASC